MNNKEHDLKDKKEPEYIKKIKHDLATLTPAAWLEELAKRNKRLREALRRNPRVEEVLLSGKGFLIITSTEPYFGEVCNMIREHQLDQETWTYGDDLRYDKLMREFELNMLKGETNE